MQPALRCPASLHCGGGSAAGRCRPESSTAFPRPASPLRREPLRPGGLSGASSRRRRLSFAGPAAAAPPSGSEAGGSLRVRGARADDWERFKDLWDQYCVFYSTEVPLEITEHTWRRCLDDDDKALMCLVAEVDADPTSVVGFATGIVHPSTFSKREVLYLEDLFVAPEARRMGVASALIYAMKGIVEDRGYRKLYWHTLEDNKTAQSLYDKLGTKTDFILYATAK